MVKNLSAMQETWVQSLGQEDPLEKGMAPHSSILAWRIPWTEEDDRLQSVGSQRVGHDWATFPFFTECIYSVLKTIYMGGYMVSPSLEVCVRTPLRAGFIENSATEDCVPSSRSIWAFLCERAPSASCTLAAPWSLFAMPALGLAPDYWTGICFLIRFSASDARRCVRSAWPDHWLSDWSAYSQNCSLPLPEFLIQWVWTGFWEFALLTGSQIMLMLLARGPYFENH